MPCTSIEVLQASQSLGRLSGVYRPISSPSVCVGGLDVAAARAHLESRPGNRRTVYTVRGHALDVGKLVSR